MATTKKATVKRKSTTPKKRATRSSKPAAMRSLRVAKPQTPFMTFSFTNQTVYWLIILAMVAGLVTYVLNVESKINAIYDQVDANTAQLELLPVENSMKKDKRAE